MTEMSPVGTLTLLRAEEKALARSSARTSPPGRAGACSASISRSSTRRATARRPTARPRASCSCAGRPIVSGYFNNEEAGKKQIDAEGWFATGDVAKITQDGWLMIVDRTKDLVKSGGEWISSIDVENAALAVKGIANCAVIGVPHPKWNERPLLVVVKAPRRRPHQGPDPRRASPPRSPSGSCPTTWCSSIPCR